MIYILELGQWSLQNIFIRTHINYLIHLLYYMCPFSSFRVLKCVWSFDMQVVYSVLWSAMDHRHLTSPWGLISFIDRKYPPLCMEDIILMENLTPFMSYAGQTKLNTIFHWEIRGLLYSMNLCGNTHNGILMKFHIYDNK